MVSGEGEKKKKIWRAWVGLGKENLDFFFFFLESEDDRETHEATSLCMV